MEAEMGIIAGVLVAMFMFGFLAYALFLESRKKQNQTKVLLAALEKGQELPENLFQPPVNYLVRGLILTAFGMALFIALWVQVGLQVGVWGLVPGLVGVAYLLVHFLQKKKD
jgi:hypothetical protein